MVLSESKILFEIMFCLNIYIVLSVHSFVCNNEYCTHNVVNCTSLCTGSGSGTGTGTSIGTWDFKSDLIG